jgi:hypothetical protein
MRGLCRMFLQEGAAQDDERDAHEEHGARNPDDEPADLLISQCRYEAASIAGPTS